VTDALLEIVELDAFHGDLQALFGISMAVRSGEILAVVGANGAGKSTLLSAIVGLIPRRADSVIFKHRPIGALPANRVVWKGIALVPEGRRLFPSLTVEENIIIGGRMKRQGAWSMDRVYKLFPVLKEKRRVLPGALSGGQQQMVAIARALMSNPDLLLLDELSLGLDPIAVRDVYGSFSTIASEGISTVLVEQDLNRVLSTADRLVCLQEGRVTLSGGAKVLSRAQISDAYFGRRS
jgi:branched-chain amino acid transport system ATP-binding protein